MNKEDYDSTNKEKSNGYYFSSNRYFSKPVWVRYFGLQTDSVNERLLEYNVRAILVSVPIVLFVLLIL